MTLCNFNRQNFYAPRPYRHPAPIRVQPRLSSHQPRPTPPQYPVHRQPVRTVTQTRRVSVGNFSFRNTNVPRRGRGGGS